MPAFVLNKSIKKTTVLRLEITIPKNNFFLAELNRSLESNLPSISVLNTQL